MLFTVRSKCAGKNRFVNNCDFLTIFLMLPSRLIPICSHALARRNNVFTGPMFAMQLKSIYSATLLKTSHYPYFDSAHKFLRNTTGDRYRNLTYQPCTFTIDNPRQIWASGKPSYIIITIKSVIKQKCTFQALWTQVYQSKRIFRVIRFSTTYTLLK